MPVCMSGNASLNRKQARQRLFFGQIRAKTQLITPCADYADGEVRTSNRSKATASGYICAMTLQLRVLRGSLEATTHGRVIRVFSMAIRCALPTKFFKSGRA